MGDVFRLGSIPSSASATAQLHLSVVAPYSAQKGIRNTHHVILYFFFLTSILQVMSIAYPFKLKQASHARYVIVMRYNVENLLVENGK